MGVTEGNEATAYERCYEVDRELEPAWLAVRGVQRTTGGKVWFLCIKCSNTLASYSRIGEEGRIGDSRDASKESEH